MASKVMMEIANHVISSKQLSKCFVVHRIGFVGVSQASILIAASSPHRKEAHEAVMEILNHVKSRVPIWKKVIYSNIDEVGNWSNKSEAFWLKK